MNHRFASIVDYGMLALWNSQLIQDEGHRNPMTLIQLEERMRSWLSLGEYRAVIFEDGGEQVAYALFRETKDEIYLRHFFVVRHRRREGLGRCAMQCLFNLWSREKRLSVSVLAHNLPALLFWRAVGYEDYILTLEIMPERPSK